MDAVVSNELQDKVYRRLLHIYMKTDEGDEPP